MPPQAVETTIPTKKPGVFFPSGLKKVKPHAITSDIIMLIMILTTFTLPLYLAFPFVIKGIKEFISEASKALLWLVGVILLGIVIVGLILGGEKLFGSSKKVEVVVAEVVVQEEKKLANSGIGEDPKVKKVWKEKVLSETSSTPITTTTTTRSRSRLSTPDLISVGIELNEINDSPSSRLRKRNV